MENKTKTLSFTIILSIISSLIALVVQLRANASTSGCSYLDPITIDILATLVALFLIIEGCYKIIKNLNQPLKNQLARSIRVAIGAAVLTIHILQFIHK